MQMSTEWSLMSKATSGLLWTIVVLVAIEGVYIAIKTSNVLQKIDTTVTCKGVTFRHCIDKHLSAKPLFSYLKPFYIFILLNSLLILRGVRD